MRRAIGLVLSWALAWAGVAAAQSPSDLARARQHFEEGRAAYEDGRFEAALEHFQEAHRLTDDADLLYNVGATADRLRRDDLALVAYRGYLAARPGSTDREQVEGRIRILEERLAAEAEAREREEAERAQRDAEARTLRAQLAESEDVGPAPWILVGSGAALVVGGVALLVVSAVDAACVTSPSGCVEAPEAPRWGEVREGYDRIPAFQAVGGVLLGLGAAAAIAGVVWAVSAGGRSAEVALGPAGVALRGRF